MKYIKCMSMTIVALGIYNLFCSIEQTPELPTITIMPMEAPLIPSENIPAETVPEKDTLEDWQIFLQTLDEENNWNPQRTIPQNEWKDNAFGLAKRVVIKDNELAETVKDTFFVAIKAKTNGDFKLETVDLISQFKTMIDSLLIPASIEIVPEETKTTVSTKIATEQAFAETQPQTSTITEPPLPVVAPPQETFPEVPKEISDTAQLSASQEKQEADNKKQWQEKLNKLKTEGKDWFGANSIMQEIYQLAPLLRTVETKEKELQELQTQLYDALEVREHKKNLYRLNKEEEMNKFKQVLGIFSPREQQAQYIEEQRKYQQLVEQESYAQSLRESQKEKEMKNSELEKLRKEFAQKDAQAKREREEQKRKEEEQRKKEMVLQASLAEAHKKGDLSARQVSELQTSMKAMAQRIKDAEKAKELAKRTTAQQIAEKAQQIVEKEKQEKEKGWIQAGKDWLLGSDNQKIIEALKKEQETLFTKLAQNDIDKMKILQEFQRELWKFNTDQFWQKEDIRSRWMETMPIIIRRIVFDYKILSLTDIAIIMEKTLLAFERMVPKTIKELVKTIIKPLEDEEKEPLLRQQKKEEKQQQRKALEEEKEQQRLLVIKRKEEEEQRKKFEEERLRTIAANYKNEKKYWYALLDELAQNKNATTAVDNKYAQQALEKSQTLLRLAELIPTKDKKKISQKLKQKFALAFLEQQKINPETVNIYHIMDWFNNTLNTLVE